MALAYNSVFLFTFSLWILLATAAVTGSDENSSVECTNVSGSVGQCTVLLSKAIRAGTDAKICRYQRKFIRCMERLDSKCDISDRYEELLVMPIRMAMTKLCQPNIYNAWKEFIKDEKDVR